MLLAQFSTKLNQYFIKFWEYLDSKSTNIYTRKKILKNETKPIFFPETVAANFRKKIGDLTKIRFLPFLHEAVTVSEKNIREFKDF